MLIEGVYEWGTGLLVSAECLGKDYTTSVAGRTVTVTIPSFEASSGRVLTGDPLGEPTWTQEPRRGCGFPDSWGSLFLLCRSGAPEILSPASARVDRIRYAFEIDVLDKSGKAVALEVMRGLDQWWASASAWIDILTGQSLITRPEFVTTARLLAWTQDELGNSVTVAPPGAMHMKLFPVNLRNELLARCFRLAGRGAIPPPQWMFIRDALIAVPLQDWRRVVLDSATAAEMAITTLIDDRLQGVDSTLRGALLSKYKMLGPLSTLLVRLGAGTLPPKFEEDLIKIRNKAMHTGVTPTQVQAKAAMTAAIAIVEQAVPRSNFT